MACVAFQPTYVIGFVYVLLTVLFSEFLNYLLPTVTQCYTFFLTKMSCKISLWNKFRAGRINLLKV